MGIILTLIMIFVIWYRPPFMEQLEARAYDIRFKMRFRLNENKDIPGAKEIVVIAMDERSITKLGRWPWPRNDWAQFFINLDKYQPKAIVADVFFSEPDQNINVNFLKDVKEKYLRLAGESKKQEPKPDRQEESEKPDPFIPYIEGLEARANTDQALVQALAQVKNVVLGWFYFQTEDEAAQLAPGENERRRKLVEPFAIKIIQYRSGATPFDLVMLAPQALGFQVNLPMFTDKITGSGYISVVSDEDGIIRSAALVSGWPPFKEDEGLEYYKDYLLFPSLDLEAMRVYLGQSPIISVEPYPLGIQEIKIGDYRIPVSEGGQMLINYLGAAQSFPTCSFYDVYSDFQDKKDADPGQLFKGKLVLIGATSTGLFDLRTTPLGTMAGIYMHANIIDNILSNRALYRPTWMWGFDLIAITILGLLLSLIYPRIRPVFSAGLVIVLTAGYLAVNYYFFNKVHISLTIIYPVASILVVYIGITLYHYTMEEREKRFIRSAFGFYLAPEVITDLLSNPNKLKLGGERKRVTVFFSDLAGFTSLSEKMEPEQLVHLLNQYLTEMSEITLKNRGTIDKFEGDAIMAFFGAPVDYPDHAAAACLSAIEMQARLNELNEKKWGPEGFPQLVCRIGLNTGEVLVGNMGSARRMDYTVMGDEVNLANRLEGANKAYGTKIMISESTYLDAKDLIEARELDLIGVVGRTRPVRVYEVIAEKGRLDPRKKELITLFQQGIEFYRGQKFDQAGSLFKKCLELFPDDSPSQVYRERCQTYLESPPPPDWDGVFRLAKK